MANLRPQQVRGGHAMVGIGAALTGVVLGFLLVSMQLDVPNESLTAAALPSLAQRCQTNSRDGQINAPLATDSSCMQACAIQDRTGERQAACVCGKELGKADAGVTNCYNPAGNCTPPGGLPACGSVKKPELPDGGQGEGQGEGKMPELPKPPQGGGGGGQPQQPTNEECQKEPKPAPCKGGVSENLLDSFKNLLPFTSDADADQPEEQPQSLADRLKSLIGFGESSSPSAAPAVNNPTEAVVTPVIPSASDAAHLTASGGTQTTQGAGGSNVNTGGQTVTGFGSGASANTDASGPILAAIRSVTARIQSLLSSLF